MKERIQELESAAAAAEEEQRQRRQNDEILPDPSGDASSVVSSVFEDDNSTTDIADDLSSSVPSFSVVESTLSAGEQTSAKSVVDPVEPPSSSIDELQEKYAKKISAQLSLIAVLQEENDIKDIQLKNLRQQLEERDGNTTTKRRFAGWRTTTTSTNTTTTTAGTTTAGTQNQGNTEYKVKNSTSKEEKEEALTTYTNPFDDVNI